MTPKKLITEVEKYKTRIAKQRDGLRELISEAEELIESCERGDEALETALDALSELV